MLVTTLQKVQIQSKVLWHRFLQFFTFLLTKTWNVKLNKEEENSPSLYSCQTSSVQICILFCTINLQSSFKPQEVSTRRTSWISRTLCILIWNKSKFHPCHFWLRLSCITGSNSAAHGTQLHCKHKTHEMYGNLIVTSLCSPPAAHFESGLIMAVKIPKFPESNLYLSHFLYRKSTCTSLRTNSDLRLGKAMTELWYNLRW